MPPTPEEISVEVLLFARMAELTGSPRACLAISKGICIGELQEQLLCKHPELKQLVAASRWAVNAEFVDRDCVIEDTDSIALIPPVSGG